MIRNVDVFNPSIILTFYQLKLYHNIFINDKDFVNPKYGRMKDQII